MELSKIYVLDQKYEPNDNIVVSLYQGSAWKNLYYPYPGKNIIIGPNSLKTLIQAYKFVIHEIKLYLCTHKDSKQALDDLELLQTNLEKLKQAKGDVSNVAL